MARYRPPPIHSDRRRRLTQIDALQPQSAGINTDFTNPIGGLVEDNLGNPAAGVAITFSGPGSGPTAYLYEAGGSNAVASTVTDANGRFSLRARANELSGSYTIRASIPGIGTFDYALTNTQSTAQQTIVFTSTPPASPVPGTTYTVAATGGASGNPVVFSIDAASTAGACTIAGAMVSLTGVGTCLINANQAGNANYSAASQAQQSIAIGKASQTITFTSTPPASPVFGGSYTVTATGGASGNPVTFSIDAASTAGACTLSGATVSFTGAGTCLVNANQAGNANYSAASQVQQSVAIGKASQTITFARPADQTFGAGPVDLVASATSGLPVTFASTTPAVCSVSGATATILTAGLCSITASQAGNATFAAAAAIVQTFTVGQASQTITFAKPADVVFASGLTLPLSATATSGLAVTFASLTTGVCTVSGATATLLAPGVCTIRASQAGNANFTAAPDVTQSFAVQGTPELTLTVAANPTAVAAVGQSVVFTYTVRNSGNVPLADVAVTDTRVSPVGCAATTLPAGASTTCTGSTSSTAADITARGIVSTATARAAFNGAPVQSPPISTTVGIDVAKVQAVTKSTIAGMLSQRGNLLASSAPDTARTHARLAGGTLFGGGDDAGGGGAPSTGFAPRGNGAGVLQRYGFGGASAGNGIGARGFGSEAASPRFASPFDRFLRNHDPTRSFGDEPELPFAMRRDRPEAGSPSPRATSSGIVLSGQGDDGMGRFQFSTSLSQLRAAAEAAEREKRASADQAPLAALGLGAGGLGERGSRPALLDAWLEGTSSYFKRDTIDGRRHGHAAVISAGVDMLVRPGLLVGVMGQVDWMADRSTTLGQERDGRGWMAGPYLSARLTPHLYFDARTAWGRSTNQVDPIGAYTDSFATTRALASAKLTGDWTSGAWRLRPSAEIIWLRETQAAYENAIGITIASNTFMLGRAVFGPELAYRRVFADQAMIEPFVGLRGVWDFSRTHEATAAGEPISNDGIRGRLEGGVTLRTPAGISVRATGAYDGLGASGYHAVQGQAKVVVPLQ